MCSRVDDEAKRILTFFVSGFLADELTSMQRYRCQRHEYAGFPYVFDMGHVCFDDERSTFSRGRHIISMELVVVCGCVKDTRCRIESHAI